MHPSWLPWSLFVLGMFAVWVAVFLKTPSFRRATLAALLVGKTFTVVYMVAGLDRPLVTLYVYPRAAPWLYRTVTITCCQALFLALLASLITTLAWPKLARQLGLHKLLEE